MGESDLYAKALAKSKDVAGENAIVTAVAAKLVADKVEAELNGFTTEEKTRFLEALEQHGNVHRACTAVGISRRSAITAQQRDPLFAAAWHDILESRTDAVESVLHDQCLDPSSANTIARIFWMKSHRRDLYGEQLRVEHKHQVDVVVELIPPRADPSVLIVDAEVIES